MEEYRHFNPNAGKWAHGKAYVYFDCLPARRFRRWPQAVLDDEWQTGLKCRMPIRRLILLRYAAAALLLGACDAPAPSTATPVSGSAAARSQICDADNGGLTLPAGFCAKVVADHFAGLRDLAAAEDGTLYAVQLNRRFNYGRLAELRNPQASGRFTHIRELAKHGGTSLALRDGALFVALDTGVLRYPLPFAAGLQQIEQTRRVVVTGLPAGETHASKAMSFDADGNLYVSIGAPSNACQEPDRVAGAHGLDPCPQLHTRAGIWRYPRQADGSYAAGERFAGGIRHTLAMAWHPLAGGLYFVQHGRDELAALWPNLYSAEQDTQVPAEEMHRAQAGNEFAWPYCYFDDTQKKYVLSPEYGGDGKNSARCENYAPPLLAFPAHASPNDMMIYTGKQFPARYHGGAFVALHGSSLQHADARVGYHIAFVPFVHNTPASAWEIFADGFWYDPLAEAQSAATAAHRPTTLAQAADGTLYIGDSITGRIWRVSYHGQ